MASCQTCRFFLNTGSPTEMYGYGTCRRYPPDTDGRFPRIESYNWCGEYDMNREELNRSYKEFCKKFPEVRP